MSVQETIDHINEVRRIIRFFKDELIHRGDMHDRSKLLSPEKEMLDKMTPNLPGTTYGSKEYYGGMLQEFLDHHYAGNRHHPGYFKNGINDMTLVDIFEMFIDGCAAMKRHKDGNFEQSLKVNTERFNLSPQLAKILKNTYDEYKDNL